SLQYFATSAPKHTDDEEESLFPRLRATGDPAAAEDLGLLEGLEADHDEAESLHSAVDLLVRRWIADDGLVAAEAAHLREHLARLQAIYRRHIAIEDQDLFPAAARLLDASTIHEIGREMAARRKVASEAKGEPRR
ncbi:MAG: hemerythrin domain-containing protein, partial [Acidobacteria bacterium]